MSLSVPLVLSPDVHVIPVAGLPVAMRERLGGDGSGHALTHPHARSSSTLVNDGFAELLREFQTPSTVVEAVLRYSTRLALGAESVLEDAFPALRRCLDQGYLVEASSPRALRHRDSFAPGDQIGGGIVLRCLQGLEDTEVYQLAREDGSLAALKVLRPGSSEAAAVAFGREARILGELDGHIAPRLVDTETSGVLPWLAMEWCEGARVTTAAAALRATADGRGRLLDLCAQVSLAYAGLHDVGIVHGDVHPGNAIVTPDGTVRLVDFGLARRLDGLVDDLPARGGAPGFLSPDHAAALLAGQVPAPPTPLSELFSLGALLYEMFTGAAYLDFSVDDEEMLRQVVRDPPLPFTRRGRAAWPEVEEALRGALAKDEERRMPSVAELSRRLSTAGSAPRSTQRRGTSIGGLEALLTTMLARAGPGGTWFERGIPTAPMCSIAYGSAGLAVAIHHVALLRDDPALLALADEWSVRAASDANDPGAFRNPGLDVTEQVTGRVSPFHRLSGVHAAQALVSHSLSDIGSAQRALDAFARDSLQPCDSFDLTLGRTGTLLGATIIVEAFQDDPHVDLDAVTSLGKATYHDLWRWLDSLPPVAEATQLAMLGVAHGWSGPLLASLRWCSAVSATPQPSVIDRLDQLAALAHRDGQALHWPWSTAGPSTMRGWCNGSAGLVHLWTAAHAAFGDERWLHLAEGAAWHAAEGSGIIPQLCCGLAGQAYAQLEMHRHSGESHWLSLARQLTTSATVGLETAAASDCVSGSLHKGEVGIAVLAADLERPEEATMPFFGPAG